MMSAIIFKIACVRSRNLSTHHLSITTRRSDRAHQASRWCKLLSKSFSQHRMYHVQAVKQCVTTWRAKLLFAVEDWVKQEKANSPEILRRKSACNLYRSWSYFRLMPPEHQSRTITSPCPSSTINKAWQTIWWLELLEWVLQVYFLLLAKPLGPASMWVVAFMLIPDPQPQQTPISGDVKTSYIGTLLYLLGQVLSICPPDLQYFCPNKPVIMLTFCANDFTAILAVLNGESNCLAVGGDLIPKPAFCLYIFDCSDGIEDFPAYIQTQRRKFMFLPCSFLISPPCRPCRISILSHTQRQQILLAWEHSQSSDALQYMGKL